METLEKFTIEVSESGMDIISGEGTHLHFSPLEAIMLLDILRNEEENLRKMADEASPMPIQIHF